MDAYGDNRRTVRKITYLEKNGRKEGWKAAQLCSNAWRNCEGRSGRKRKEGMVEGRQTAPAFPTEL